LDFTQKWSNVLRKNGRILPGISEFRPNEVRFSDVASP
jgi:hypothetical protein